MDAFRFYSPEECGKDGYPSEWHATLKHLVREQAGYRCVRCKHPYRNGTHGKGEWTLCDEQCEHTGPFRIDGAEIPWQLEGFRVGMVREAKWRILTVHHLDGNKLNGCWWNLAALCQRCHLEIQGRVKMGQVYPWEHSEWFKPYAAGFYAWRYLGENLSSEGVAARQSELLALECLV